MRPDDSLRPARAARAGAGSVLRVLAGFSVGIAMAAVAGLPMEAPDLEQPTVDETAGKTAEVSSATDLPQLLDELMEAVAPRG